MDQYTSPPGTFDLPFSWVFDASVLTDGGVYLNQFVYMKGGYGQFILRRIVGINRMMNGTTGQFNTRDAMGNNNEAFPVFAASADDIGIIPELKYPEQGKIAFDLYKTLKPGAQPGTAQIAFQGVRRMQGSPVANPSYPAHPKSFTYTMAVTVSHPVGTIVTGRVPIDNYDFELHQVIIAAGDPLAPLAMPVSSMWIYDSNKVQISDKPLLDLYTDGGPRGVYKNGAIVTPLWYPKDSQIQIDFYSQLTAGSKNVVVYLVGKKYYPGDVNDYGSGAC